LGQDCIDRVGFDKTNKVDPGAKFRGGEMISELMRQTLDATGFLHSGDHLTRTEFLRIWKSLPNLKRAELIGGIVYMPSPVSIDHADMDNNVGVWIGTYRIATPGCA
jgi:hypothetical protein